MPTLPHDLRRPMTVWKGRRGSLTPSFPRCSASSLTYMRKIRATSRFCVHLMFCAKNIERIGDARPNIAVDRVLYDRRTTDSLQAPEGRLTNFARRTWQLNECCLSQVEFGVGKRVKTKDSVFERSGDRFGKKNASRPGYVFDRSGDRSREENSSRQQREA